MKKFLSFALALLMVVGVAPSFFQPADAAALPSDCTTMWGIEATSTAPTIDGNVTEAEWGAPEQKMSKTLTGGARTYCQDFFTGAGNLIPTINAHWSFDSNNLYVGMTIEVPVYASTATHRVDTVDETLRFFFGNLDFTLTAIASGAETGLPSGVTGAVTANGRVRSVELSIPLSKIGSTTEFKGFFRHYAKLNWTRLADNVKSYSEVTTHSTPMFAQGTPTLNKIYDLFILASDRDFKDVPLTLEFAPGIEGGGITIDGKINAAEWGDADQTINGLDPTHMQLYSESKVYLPKSFEIFWRYDNNNLYCAMRINSEHWTPGVSTGVEGSYIVPRLTGKTYAGVLAFKSDMTPIYNGTPAGTSARATRNGTVMEIEIQFPWSGLTNVPKPAAGQTIGIRMDYCDKVDGTARMLNTCPGAGAGNTGALPLYTAVDAQRKVATGAAVTLDGNVTSNEWGASEFKIDPTTTEGSKRAYRLDQFHGEWNVATSPTVDFHWHYDDDYLYVGFTDVYSGAAGRGYDSWNFTNQDYNWGGTIGTLKTNRLYYGHSETWSIRMGGYSADIKPTDYAQGTVAKVGVADFVWSDRNNVAHCEMRIPLSAVVSMPGVSFLGSITSGTAYVYDMRVAQDCVDASGKAWAAGTNLARRTANLYFSTTRRYISINQGPVADMFVLVSDEDTFDPTIPSATPTPNPATPGLQPGLTPSTPSPNPYPIPAPSTPVTAASFTDVKKGDWFYEDLEYVVEAGLMNGVGNNKFAPGNDLDRAMLVTTLWRLAGEPSVNVNTFDDVPRNAWYTDAVNWAAEDGIVKGYAGCFNPTDGITREQVVAILHRYADMMGYKSSNFSNRYYETSDWAAEDVAWADANGLLDIATDMEDMTETANRAEIAALLATFCRTFVD